MEHLFRSFTRVVRKIDHVNTLIDSFPSLEDSAPTGFSFTDQDRRRILDFPEPDTQSSNIAVSSSLAKSVLLKRAVESPSSLTASEIDLLKERYWLNISSVEMRARSSASAALVAVSENHWHEVTNRLEKIRAPLYEEDEAKAIENAGWEAWRRLIDSLQAQRRQEAESAVAKAESAVAKAESAVAKARPWVKRLWEEDKGQKAWGYAVFVEPGVESGERMDRYSSRRDAVLFWARGAICCGDTVGARWKLQGLDWPAVDDAIEGDDGKAEDREPVDRFRKIREKFVAVRDRAPKEQGTEDGILQNVFLVVGKDCVDSVLSESGNVDDMWVWAVDPDYAKASLEGESKDEYVSCLRVRLQQLVNNFFELKRFQNEYSMKELWDVAQRSKNQAFVSVKDEEIGQWTMNRDVGSALRP